jgi:hypothetical protein
MRIDVGSTPLTVTALGRWVSSGNSRSHTVTIYQVVGGFTTPLSGASVVVNTAGATPGQFAYTSLSSTVVLWERGTYYILSAESGGDVWYHNNTTVTTTGDAFLSSANFLDHNSGHILADGTGPNDPFGPVDFKYNLGVPGGITRPGSILPFNSELASGYVVNLPTVITGTVTLTIGFWIGVTTAGDTFTYQWHMDGVPIGPVKTTTTTLENNTLPSDPINTTLIPDGTHIFYPVIYDAAVNLFITAKYIVLEIHKLLLQTAGSTTVRRRCR